MADRLMSVRLTRFSHTYEERAGVPAMNAAAEFGTGFLGHRYWES